MPLLFFCSEPQLQVRACNQLGSFLSAKETNLRYLSLEHLSYLATSEFSHEAVKKHQDTVINSLKVCQITLYCLYAYVFGYVPLSM